MDGWVAGWVRGWLGGWREWTMACVLVRLAACRVVSCRVSSVTDRVLAGKTRGEACRPFDRE